MPAETHQLGVNVDAESVAALLWVLLDAGGTDGRSSKRLADFGIDDTAMMDLWEAVCEEFGERSLGPGIDPGVLDPDMTVPETAATMVSLLTGDDDVR